MSSEVHVPMTLAHGMCQDSMAPLLARIVELEAAIGDVLAMTPCQHRRSMPSDCYQVLVPGSTVNRWRQLLGLDK